MDISDINNIGHAWASWERDEANKGKGVRSKGWVTKEQMRKNAAQKTLGIMIAVSVLTVVASIFLKVFGKTVGAIMMVVLVLGLPICFFIQENSGCNVQWTPLWIVGIAFLLKMFFKLFGRKWGLRIGIPMLAIVGAGVFLDKKKDAGFTSPAIESLDSGASSNSVVDEGGKEDEAIKVANKKMEELVQQIKEKTDANSGVRRAREIKKKFNEIITGLNSYTAEEAYAECYKYADASGWLKGERDRGSANKNEKRSHREEEKCPGDNASAAEINKADLFKEDESEAELGALAKVASDGMSDANETAPAEAAQYLEDMSARLDELFAKIRSDKKPTTSDYELDSRVEYLKNIYEQELHRLQYDHKSLSETKAVADKAYMKVSKHAYRMHWIISDDEKCVEQDVALYLNGISAKLKNLCVQVRANKRPTTTNYELNSRVEYLKGMFDREMRFPLRDRWNSFEEAKQHADKAYKACLDHALGMGWIDGMSFNK